MKKNVFDLKNFNILEDDNYYYVFRALNNEDYNDIYLGKTINNGDVGRIRTDRERYEEVNKISKYSGATITIDEVYDHIKMHHLKNTNCISLSSNANVTIDYGKNYHEQYAMVKIPKKDFSNFYEAGKYMLNEIERLLEEKLTTIQEESLEKKYIKEIEKCENLESIDVIFKNYVNSINNGNNKNYNDRFSRKQFFSLEQQLEYNKIIAKMTILEASCILPSILKSTSDNSSLLSTVGNAFSSSELIHYGDLTSNDFVMLSPKMMSMIALLQQAKEINNNVKVNQLIAKIIDYALQGYDIKNINGKVYLANNQNSIDLNLSIEEANIFSDDNINDSDLTIEKIYSLTGGRVRYEKAIQSLKFTYNLTKSKQRATYYSRILKAIVNESKYNETINNLSNLYDVESSIIDRKNNIGKKISEAVSIGMNKFGRKFFSNREQTEIIQLIDNLTEEERRNLLIGKTSLISLIIEKILDKEQEVSENEYYVEAIVEGLDFNKIYKYSLMPRAITNEEKFNLCNKLYKGNCKNLYNAFLKCGVKKDNIPNYILNLYLEKGYKGYSFEELSKLPELENIISKNIQNLNYNIIPIELDKALGIEDDLNEVKDTYIKLRDYQIQTVNAINSLYNSGKRFGGVVLPTGAGKSFIAMTMMNNYNNGNIVYFAPNQEILRQIQRHIVRYIINYGKTDKEKEFALSNPDKYGEIIRERFPHLRLYCYQGLTKKEEDDLEKLNADLIILDELHRTGAATWNPKIISLIEKNKDAKILGLTATPIRDDDGKNMMLEMAKITGDYTSRELMLEKYLAMNMNVLDAMRDKIVVTPDIVSFDYTLENTEDYQEVVSLYEHENNPEKKEQLAEIYQEMKRMIVNSKLKGIKGIINENIKKKDGKYIVFLPRNNSSEKVTSEEYVKRQIEIVKEYFSDIDTEPEIGYLISDRQNKNENTQAIKNFENSKSNHLKLIFAIDMLNEGVHVDGIDGLFMLRPISDNSTILYLQQLGRSIYSLDPNNPTDEKDIPVVFDIYNNYLILDLNRKVNKTSIVSDLERFKSVYFWIQKHGYIPDINSINLNEARRAKLLKRIKMKYEKYLTQPFGNNLTEKDVIEITEILELGKTIDLWNMDIPDRVISPDEKEIDQIETFKAKGETKKFLDLVKKSRRIAGIKQQSEKAKSKICLAILDILNEYGYDINNNSIKMDCLLSDLLGKLPSYAIELFEELDIETDYPLGIEYNKVKNKFYYSKNNPYEEFELDSLIKLGLYEPFIQEGEKISFLDGNDFIIKGPSKFKTFNIHTRSLYDNDGYNIKGVDSRGFNREHYNVETGSLYTNTGFDYLGINKDTKTFLDIHNFDIDGNFYEIINKKYVNTGKKYNNAGFNQNGRWYDQTQKNQEISFYNPEGYDINGLSKRGFDRDGFYWKEDYTNSSQEVVDLIFQSKFYPHTIKRIKTNSKIDNNGFDKDGLAPRRTKNGETVLFKLNKYNFDVDGYYYEKKDGKYIKVGRHDPRGFDVNGYIQVNKNNRTIYYKYDDRYFDRAGYYWELTENKKRIKTNRKVDDNGFNVDGMATIINTEGQVELNRINKYGFDYTGIYHNGKKYSKYNTTKRDNYGFNVDGIHSKTHKPFNEEGFDRDGYYWENGKKTDKKYDKGYFDIDHCYWKLDENNERQKTNSLRDEEGYDQLGLNKIAFNRKGEYKNQSGVYYNEFGFDCNGINKDTKKRYDKRMFLNAEHIYQRGSIEYEFINLVTGMCADIRGFKINGLIYTDTIAYIDGNLKIYNFYGGDQKYLRSGQKQDGRGFDADGINYLTGTKYDKDGYNAFRVDENGKMSNGELHPDIIFAKRFISQLILQQNPKNDEFINDYLNKKLETLDNRIEKDRLLVILLYGACTMHPQVKQELIDAIDKLKRKIDEKQKEFEIKKDKVIEIKQLLSIIESVESFNGTTLK